VFRFPKISISFSAATLTATLQNFTKILAEGEVAARPASSYEIPQQHVRSQQNFQPVGDLGLHVADINKQLLYSPKPSPMGIRPFAHIEQKALSPHVVEQELATPVHNNPNQ